MSHKELVVSALENGTVLDHIPAQYVYKALDLLGLNDIESQITIGINLASKIYGKKGIIKIADKFFEDEELNKLALIAPKATINIIRDGKLMQWDADTGKTYTLSLKSNAGLRYLAHSLQNYFSGNFMEMKKDFTPTEWTKDQFLVMQPKKDIPAAAFIKEQYGEAYLPKVQKEYKNKNTAQNAHEAIRPTYIS